MKYYSIHGVVGVSVDSSYPWHDTLNNDLPIIFKCDKESHDNCRFSICITYDKENLSSESNNRIVCTGNTIIDTVYGIKLTVFNNCIDIRTNQECNEWFIFCLYYGLSVSGYSMIHAAALSANEKALLIPSAGGTGKTILTLNLILENEYALLGDDLCIINKDGIVLSYPKNMVIYPWHYEFLNDTSYVATHKRSIISSEIKEKLKLKLRKYPKVLAYIRRHNPNLKQISPNSILSDNKIVQSSRAFKLLYLDRNTLSTNYTADEMVNKIYTTTRHELFHYFNIHIESIVRDYNILQGHYLYYDQLSIIHQFLNNCDFGTVCIPRNISNKKLVAEFLKYI